MRRRILMIDDDRMQFRLTQQHLRAFRGDEYELDWAADYGSGLERLLGGDYAACLLDYQLGEHDGLELIRAAVARGCRVPIIFLTAESDKRVDIEAMNAGALDYLVKGEINPRILERSLRYALKLSETLTALRRLATHDELTGLLNRREFDRFFAEEIERSRRFSRSFALIMLDLDHFKEVNDRHGHPAGDAVLQELARRLGREVRTVDRLARLGGEEFGVLMVEAESGLAVKLAEKLRGEIEREPMTIPGGIGLSITVSLGVAIYPDDATTRERLVALADQALYRAKQEGRNRVAIAGGAD